MLTFGFLCWYGGLRASNRNVLDRVVSVSVIGEKQECLSKLYERRVVRKARVIVKDSTHVLAQYYNLLPSKRRFNVPRASTARSRNSFINKSVVLLNKCCKDL